MFLSTDHPYHRHETVDLPDVTLASFRRRANAFALDGMLVFMPSLALTAVLSYTRARRESSGLPAWLAEPRYQHFFTLGLFLGYFAFATYLGRGQTVGKRWQRIRVVPLFHADLTFWQCCERALGYGASALEAGFGF